MPIGVFSPLCSSPALPAFPRLGSKNGNYLNQLRSFMKIEVFILDDWICDLITLPVARDLLEVIDDRFLKTATIIASHMPVADWHTRFPDPTLAVVILDRCIHNAYRMSMAGESQRKLQGFRSIMHT